MDMFDFIEANESAVIESQGLRADHYEIMGIDHMRDPYDGEDVYTLDIRPRRGLEAEIWGDEYCGEITRTELLELSQEA